MMSHPLTSKERKKENPMADNDKLSGPENFIKLVGSLREAQKRLKERSSAKTEREVARLETLVDAWLVAHAIDMQKLAVWAGQKVN